VQAWNAGQAAGAAGELQQAAVLMAVCGELYAAMPAPSQAALHKRKVRVAWRSRVVLALALCLGTLVAMFAAVHCGAPCSMMQDCID